MFFYPDSFRLKSFFEVGQEGGGSKENMEDKVILDVIKNVFNLRKIP